MTENQNSNTVVWSLPILWHTKMYENLSKSSFFLSLQIFSAYYVFTFRWSIWILRLTHTTKEKKIVNKQDTGQVHVQCVHFTKPSQIAPKNQCGDVNAWHGFLFNAPQFVVVLKISQSLKNEAGHLVSNEANHIEYVRS